MSWPSISILPVTRAIGIVSFMRLMQRRNVDLPQPDGPIKRRHGALRNVEIDIVQRVLVAVVDVDVARDHLGAARSASAARRAAACRPEPCVFIASSPHPTRYQRRSNRLRRMIAAPFITNRNTSSTMIAAAVFAWNAISGRSDQR